MPRFSRSQGLRFHLLEQMSIPDRTNSSGGSGQMGQNGVNVPEEAVTGETGGQTANTMCEVPVSNNIGVYRFDFTRLLDRTLGSRIQTGGSPNLNFLGLFRQIKFSKGHMKITRVDAGGRATLITLAGPPIATFPFNAGKPLPLKIHYIRLSAHEPSWSEVLLDPRIFMADRRRRTVTLMPNKSVTFSFTPIRFHAPTYLAHTIRDYSNTVSTEQDQFRRVELPSRSTRLGWIDTHYAGYGNFVPISTSPNTAGLNAGSWRIVSTTIAFCFEVDDPGVYSQAATGTLIPPLLPFNSTFGSFQPIMWRRQESCTVHLRGIQDTILAEADYGGTPYSGVGKIFTVHAWNSTGGFTSTPNVLELFDPPRFNSIVTNTGFAGQGPLYRPTDGTGGWSSAAVPMDIQSATVHSAGAVPAIPPATGTFP